MQESKYRDGTKYILAADVNGDGITDITFHNDGTHSVLYIR